MDKYAGIYQIINIVNMKIYIGSAIDLCGRRRSHFNTLKRNSHRNPHLQKAYNKYGKENFIFEILEFVKDISKLLELEDQYISSTDCTNPDIGYNICKRASSQLGMVRSEESRKRMSDGRRKGENSPNWGRKASQEARENMSLSRKGKYSGVNSPTYGRKMSDESRKKMSDSQKNRPPMSEETRKKISQSNKGKRAGMIASDETRKKLSESRSGEKNPNFGKITSEETRKKISEGNKGKTVGKFVSEETRNNISNGTRGEKNHNSKLNENEVLEIKKMIYEGIKNIDIANVFGVSDKYISAIKNEDTWGWLKYDPNE